MEVSYPHVEIRMEGDVIVSSFHTLDCSCFEKNPVLFGSWSNVKFNLCNTYKDTLQRETPLFYIFICHIHV